MKKKSLFVTIGAIVLLIGALIGIYFIFSEDEDYSDKRLRYEDFVIERGHMGSMAKYDVSLYVDGYLGSKEEAYYITGNLISKNHYDFVLLTFNLYDKDDNLLGIAQGGLSDVKKDEELEFKALSLTTYEDTKKITRYELKDIVGN